MEIRPAVQADLTAWAEMRSLLWPESADDHAEELAQYFDGQSIDIVETFVLEDPPGSLAGFIELNIRGFVEGSRSARVPYVEAWFVKEAHRGKGYGKGLMERAGKWATELGYAELASDTDIDNDLSITLHKHLGFDETVRVVCFLKQLTS